MRRLLAALWNAHRRHPAQLILLVAGLSLSVAVVVAIDLTIVSARDAFAESQRWLSGNASHQLRAVESRLDQRLLVELKSRSDVRQSAPVVEGTARIADSGERVRVMGVDPVAEAAFRPWLAVALQGGGVSAGSLGAMLGRDDALAVGTGLADRLGLSEGAALTLRVAGALHSMRVVAVLADGGPDGSNEDLLVMDIPAAQRVLGVPGRLSRIDLRLADGAGDPLIAALPPGLILTRTAEADADLAQISRAFETNLQALSLLALLVGVFLVFQTLTFLALRRRGLIGLLRALGVSRRELAALLLSEAALLGLLAGLSGIAVGIALGNGLLETVARTYNDLYFRLSVSDVALSLGVLAKALILAVAGALLASFLPLRDALRVPALANLRQRLDGSRATRRIAGSLWPALLLLAAGGAALRFGPDALWFAFAAIFLMLAAALGVIPWFAKLLLDGVHRWLGARLPALPTLVLSSLRGSLGRTGIAVSALTLAVATLIGMSTMIHSFQLSVGAWVDRSLRASFYLSAEDGGTIPGALIEDLKVAPGVTAVSQMRRRAVSATEGSFSVIGVDLPESAFDGYTLLAGDSEAAWRRWSSGDALISEPLANRLGLGLDAVLTVPSVDGPVRLKIAGVYRDYASAQGAATISLARYRALFRDTGVSNAGIFAEPEARASLEAELRQRIEPHQGVGLISAKEIRARTMDVFARTFAVTDLLRLLAGAIAVVAVLGALLALQLERLPEHALLRSLGVGGAGLASIQLAQAGLLGGLAALLSVPLGVAMAWLLIEVINLRSFGWSMALELPLDQVVVAMLLAIGSAVLAGLLPARRAARMNLARVLREQPL
ncbi:MAG: FtsX-like permease family protein [Xanthomonadaceae bacterium]|nr:FtsX-like permease family protein [Xanthomonadaceae bacterium]